MNLRLFGVFMMVWSFVITLPSSVLAASSIGSIKNITGTIFVQRNEEKIELQDNADIFLHDKIIIDKEDYAELLFADDTSILLTGDGELTIDQYLYSPEMPENNTAKFRILGAAFKYIGGKISKGHDNVGIDLDFGSVGIRGTTFYRTMHDGECWIYLEEGNILVKNNAGIITLNPQEGTRMSNFNIAPAPPERWTSEDIDFIKKKLSANYRP